MRAGDSWRRLKRPMTLKERTAAISLAASLVLAAAKLAIGLAIGSLALITDALHSCVDFLATGVTWMAVRVADRPPDAVASLRPRQIREHRGARRGGAASAPRRRRRWWRRRPHPDRRPRRRRSASSRSACFLVEIVINAWRARELRRVGRETQSAALEADSLHFASDVFSSFAVLARLRDHRRRAIGWGDAAAAIGVAALIAVLALRLAHADDQRAGRPRAGRRRRAHRRAHRWPSPACSAWRMCGVRSVGPRHFVEATIDVPRSLGLEQAADVEAQAALAARTVLTGADVTIQSRAGLAERRDGARARAARRAARARRGASHHRPASERPAGAGARPRGGRRAAARRRRTATADRLEAAIRREFGRRPRSRSTSSRSSPR